MKTAPRLLQTNSAGFDVTDLFLLSLGIAELFHLPRLRLSSSGWRLQSAQGTTSCRRVRLRRVENLRRVGAHPGRPTCLGPVPYLPSLWVRFGAAQRRTAENKVAWNLVEVGGKLSDGALVGIYSIPQRITRSDALCARGHTICLYSLPSPSKQAARTFLLPVEHQCGPVGQTDSGRGRGATSRHPIEHCLLHLGWATERIQKQGAAGGSSNTQNPHLVVGWRASNSNGKRGPDRELAGETKYFGTSILQHTDTAIHFHWLSWNLKKYKPR